MSEQADPVFQSQRVYLKGASLEQQLAGVAKNKSQPLILVCASGLRSKRALAVAKKLGYEQAHSLSGGLNAWKEANLPVEKA